MGYETHVLVVASETLESPELADEIKRQAHAHPLRVSLLAPPTVHRRAETSTRLERVVRRLADSGIAATGLVGVDAAVRAR